MKERDFEWCFEHEILFRDWWSYINEIIADSDCWLDNDSFFLCWKKAKEYALEIANSVDPQARYRLTFRDIFFNTHDYKHWLLSFTNAMIMSIKNENLEEFVSKMKKHTFESLSKFVFNENSSDIKSPEFQLFYCIERFEKKPDYDYSLPDGGITETKTITKTDGTITKTETDAGTAENNKTLLEELTPIFYGNKEQAEDYIKKIKNITKDVEKIRYTAQLVHENTISEMSCHRDLYSILHDHWLYNKSESNWNKVISQYLVKK
mgnify:FL=1